MANRGERQGACESRKGADAASGVRRVRGREKARRRLCLRLPRAAGDAALHQERDDIHLARNPYRWNAFKKRRLYRQWQEIPEIKVGKNHKDF